jgi:hypothetical protein
MQKCLLVWLVTSVCVAAWVSDVLSAFVRTNTNGVATNDCWFGYGYDSVSGYGNWYWAACPTSSSSNKSSFGGNGGSRSSTSSSNSTTKPSTNTWSTTKPSTNTWSTTKLGSQKPTWNPYGSNYVSLDDGLKTSSSSINSNIDVVATTTTTDTSMTNNAAAVTTPTITIKRVMPATGIN